MSPSLSPTRNRGLQTLATFAWRGDFPDARSSMLARSPAVGNRRSALSRIDAPELGGPGDALNGQDVGGLPVVDLRSVETLEPVQLG